MAIVVVNSKLFCVKLYHHNGADMLIFYDTHLLDKGKIQGFGVLIFVC